MARLKYRKLTQQERIKLKQTMVKYGVNQPKLANMIGKSQSYYAMLLRGQRGLPREEAEGIYHSLGNDESVDFLKNYPPYEGVAADLDEQVNLTSLNSIAVCWINLIHAYELKLRGLTRDPNLDRQEFIESVKKISNDLEGLIKKYSPP